MSVLKSLRALARYNVLTPIAILAAVAMPGAALAQDKSNAASIASDTVNIDSSYLNTGKIGIVAPTAFPLMSSGNVKTFTNAAGAEIQGTTGAIQLNGTVDAIFNYGSVTALGNGSAIRANDKVTTFINTGLVQNTGTASGVVSANGFGTFTNSSTGQITAIGNEAVYSGAIATFLNQGKISSTNQLGIRFVGSVESFTNDVNATISGAGGVSFLSGTSATTFLNNGTITGTIGIGVNYSGGGGQTFTNGSTGSIFGASTAVKFASTLGTFNNLAGGTISGVMGVQFGGAVTTFSNAGTITGTGDAAVIFAGTVGTFSNSGTISDTATAGFGVELLGNTTSFINTGNISGSTVVTGTGNVDGIGVYSQGTLGTFSNTGTITGRAAFLSFDAVTSFSNSGTLNGLDGDGAYFDGSVGTFANTGVIAGSRLGGVFIGGAATSFSNGGTISGTDGDGVYFAGSVGTFANTGVIASSRLGGVFIGGASMSFSNSGTISGTDGVYITGNVWSLTNSGTISGLGTTGISVRGLRILGNAGTVVNSGQITSLNGTAVVVGGTLGNLINSGTLRGGGGTALSVTGGGDDKLTILTGSQIFGAVEFGAGTDTLDFAGFMGNTVLDVTSLNTLVAGSRSFFDLRDGNGDGKVAIVDISGLGNQVVGQNDLDLVNAILSSIVSSKGGSAAAPIQPLQFAQTKPKTSALAAVDTAVLTELDTVQHMGVEVWGGFLGGGSSRTLPVDQASLYGGLVAGTHARLNETFDLGGLGGYVVTNNSTQGGQQTLATQTGVLGVYGTINVGGVADIDLALLGGLSAHTSKRQVIANNQVQTATGLFTSYFFAPSAGLTVPVLSGDAGTVLFKASATYVGGLTSAYTETGSAMNLAVGTQTISVFDVRAGLEGRHGIDLGTGMSGDIVVKGGLFAQVNGGSASVPVTTLGQTINVATPGTSAYGVYGGVGLDAALTDSVSLKISTDGSFRTDGLNSISIKGGIAGTF